MTSPAGPAGRAAPGGRSRASGQDTRRRILQAAEDLFAREGYDNVTVRDIAAAARADPALVIRYFGSKNDLFLAARRPDFNQVLGTTRPLTVSSLTRALVGFILKQGTRVFDVAALGGEDADGHIRHQLEELLVKPVLDEFGLQEEEDRARVEVIAALVVGAGFLRQRIRTPSLSALDAEEMTDLLEPLVAGLLRRGDAPASD